MAYNEDLADRIRATLGRTPRITETRMFGGVAFMVGGNMFCGIIRDDLMVRIGRDDHDAALKEPYTRPMDFAGRPMRGMIYVEPAGYGTDASLSYWVDKGLFYCKTLPSKIKPKPKAKRSKQPS